MFTAGYNRAKVEKWLQCFWFSVAYNRRNLDFLRLQKSMQFGLASPDLASVLGPAKRNLAAIWTEAN